MENSLKLFFIFISFNFLIDFQFFKCFHNLNIYLKINVEPNHNFLINKYKKLNYKNIFYCLLLDPSRPKAWLRPCRGVTSGEGGRGPPLVKSCAPTPLAPFYSLTHSEYLSLMSLSACPYMTSSRHLIHHFSRVQGL